MVRPEDGIATQVVYDSNGFIVCLTDTGNMYRLHDYDWKFVQPPILAKGNITWISAGKGCMTCVDSENKLFYCLI